MSDGADCTENHRQQRQCGVGSLQRQGHVACHDVGSSQGFRGSEGQIGIDVSTETRDRIRIGQWRSHERVRRVLALPQRFSSRNRTSAPISWAVRIAST